MTAPLIPDEAAAQAQPTCEHGEEYGRLLRDLRDTAWTIESAVSELPGPGDYRSPARGGATKDELEDLACCVHAEHGPEPQWLCRRESCLALADLVCGEGRAVGGETGS